MRLLGAEVRPVESGSRTLKDAVNEAIRDWVTNVRNTYYLLGSALGPHPYPTMVRDLPVRHRQRSARPDVGADGQTADDMHRLRGRRIQCHWPVPRLSRGCGRAPGEGWRRVARHRSRQTCRALQRSGLGRPGVLHGTYTYLLQDADGQVAATHSISAGLDYPAVGPEHAYLRDLGRAHTPMPRMTKRWRPSSAWRMEGILPALESAHAVAEAIKRAPRMNERRFCWSTYRGAVIRIWIR